MKLYPLPDVRAVIFRPGMPLKTWLAQQEKKPFALVNASLYNSDGSPIGTIIENGKLRVNAGTGFGFGVDQDGGWAFGSPWVMSWQEYLTGYTGLVQNGQYVAPSFADGYVFNSRLARIGVGEKDGVLQICVADGVDVGTFGRQGVLNGLSSLCNLDGGGSRFLYYDGKTVYTSSRTPYNAIAFYKEGDMAKKFTVCVDPGHGGTDNTNGAGSYKEHEFTLDLGLRLRKLLMACGVNVIMTRDTDKTVSLTDRAAAANSARADYFVSLHSNAAGDGSARGLCVYTANSCSANATLLANRIVNAAEMDGIPTFGNKTYKQNFTVLVRTSMPAVLIEHGFHTNEKERALLASDAYRDRLAEMDARAICDQIGVAFRAPSPAQTTPPDGYDKWLACMEWYEAHKT
jgi:N-acetylmuramoyl-L-alanine amidase